MGINPTCPEQKEQFKGNLKPPIKSSRGNPSYKFSVDTPGRCIFDMDDNSLTLGGDLPDLPLEPQIKDQVTVIFNKLRAEKRENELAKNLLPDIGKFIQIPKSVFSASDWSDLDNLIKIIYME